MGLIGFLEYHRYIWTTQTNYPLRILRVALASDYVSNKIQDTHTRIHKVKINYYLTL